MAWVTGGLLGSEWQSGAAALGVWSTVELAAGPGPWEGCHGRCVHGGFYMFLWRWYLNMLAKTNSNGLYN